jgi:hypothetical protein
MGKFGTFSVPNIGDKIPCQICNSGGDESGNFLVVKSDEDAISQFCKECKSYAERIMDQDGEEPSDSSDGGGEESDTGESSPDSVCCFNFIYTNELFKFVRRCQYHERSEGNLRSSRFLLIKICVGVDAGMMHPAQTTCAVNVIAASWHFVLQILTGRVLVRRGYA